MPAAAAFLACGAAHASLIGYYSFNGNVLDSSGNGKNGTVHGTVQYTATPWGEALTLDGTSKSNYVTIPIDTTIASMPQMTYGGWFYMPQTPSQIEEMITNDDGGYDRTLEVRGGSWVAQNGPAGGWAAGPAVTPKQWTFVGVSYDNTAGTYLFDVGTHQYTGSTTFNNSSIAGVTYIGVNPFFNYEFDGSIANVFVYNQALTGAQLSQLEAAGPSGFAPEPGTVALFGLAGICGGAFHLLRRRQEAGR